MSTFFGKLLSKAHIDARKGFYNIRPYQGVYQWENWYIAVRSAWSKSIVTSLWCRRQRICMGTRNQHTHLYDFKLPSSLSCLASNGTAWILTGMRLSISSMLILAFNRIPIELPCQREVWEINNRQSNAAPMLFVLSSHQSHICPVSTRKEDDTSFRRPFRYWRNQSHQFG